jgi:hypothetical protein
MGLWAHRGLIFACPFALVACGSLFGSPPPQPPRIIASPIVDSASQVPKTPQYPKPYCVDYNQAQQDKIATALASLPRDNVLIGLMTDYHTMRVKVGCIKS